jgi:hypothetical protein
LLQKRERDLAIPQDVKKTPEWSRHRDIMNRGEVLFGNLVVVKSKHGGQWSATSESLRNSHVELRRVQVCKLE